MKVLLKAMEILPKYDGTNKFLYRGVSHDVCKDENGRTTMYDIGQTFRWWGFTSCSVDADQAKVFSKPVPILFNN